MTQRYRWISLAALATLLVAAAWPQPAAAQHGCPRCAAPCRLNVERVDEEQECFTVELQQICIPRVVFPWQRGACDPCANNGARVKTVKQLKSHKYSCPACQYTWSPARTTDPCPCESPGSTADEATQGAGDDAPSADLSGMIADPAPPVRVAPVAVPVVAKRPKLIQMVGGIFANP